MRIINVIQNKEGIVDSIESYPIHEQQFSNEVIDKAEKDFTVKAIELGADKNNMYIYIENGYYSIMNASVCLVWSYID